MTNLGCRNLFVLCLAASCLLLGFCAPARAGYLPSSPPQLIPQDDLFADAAPQAFVEDAGPSMAGSPAADEAQLRPDDGPAAWPASRSAPAGLGCEGACSGAGYQSSSDRPGDDGPSQRYDTTSPPRPDAPAPSGVLFLESTRRALPPFPSLLFRPPRSAGL